MNNRVRGELANALAVLKLFDADRAVRLASAQKLQTTSAPAWRRCWPARWRRRPIRTSRRCSRWPHAQANLGSADPAVRLAAVKALAETTSPTVIRALLQPLTDKDGDRQPGALRRHQRGESH